MARRRKVKLSSGLLDAVREQRAVLFLGSGASMGALGRNQCKMPGSAQLAQELSDRFFSGKFAKYDLMRVAELAASQGGRSAYNQWLHDFFTAFEPTEAHLLLPTFRWKALATTNYDLLVEKAYERADLGAQSLVVRYKDDQPFGPMLDEHMHPLPFLKLHGCARHALDDKVPLVLTPTSYNNHESNRTRLYAQIEELSAAYPVVYCGHSLSDLHIRRLSEEGDRSARPFHYLVSPDLEDEEVALWAERRVEGMRATFAEFMQALDAELGPLMRLPRQGDAEAGKPYRKFFTVNQDESDRLAAAFRTDFVLVHSGIAVEAVDARRFYSGHDQGWGAIRREFDVQRRVSHRLLEFMAESTGPGPQLAVLRGAAGYGKSIALRRAAWELGASLGELVIWADDDARIWPDVLQELHDLTGRRINLFIDRAAYSIEKILVALDAARARDIPLTVVTAERRNEWSIYCQRLEKHGPEFFEVTRLSETEAEDLVEKLKEHDCLGKLAEEDPARRKTIVTGKLDRQLLVILHEVTRGMPFETIIFDEYARISPPEAQMLYLDICTLNRFDVPVRAGVVSRISGILFRDFETEFFEPLEELVSVGQNRVSGDYEYHARHAHVGDIVFTQVCRTDDERFEQIVRVLTALDRSYTSDSIALSGLLRGRDMADTFEDPSFPRDIYDLAWHRNPQAAFIGQQRAIFESTHPRGSLDAAQEAIDSALKIEPENGTLHHTRSQVLRRRAQQAPSDFAKTTLRSQARAALNNVPNQSDTYVLGARVRIRVDEVADAVRRLRAGPSDGHRDELAIAVDEAERAIARAINHHPSDPDLLQAEARLREELGETDEAVQLLQKAWEKMPRGSGVAMRLARKYVDQNDPDRALRTLEEAISRNPKDRSLNLMIASILFTRSGNVNDSRAKSYLVASFVEGDREHWGRFIRAAHAYATGEYSESLRLFEDIERRAPDSFRPLLGPGHEWLTQPLRDRQGRVAKSFGSYFLITPEFGPNNLYAPERASDPGIWETISVRSAVRFNIDFGRRGPIARDVRPSR